jgi:hypothetical protein
MRPMPCNCNLARQQIVKPSGVLLNRTMARQELSDAAAHGLLQSLDFSLFFCFSTGNYQDASARYPTVDKSVLKCHNLRLFIEETPLESSPSR